MTDTSHTKARILDVRAQRISDALDDDAIVLVAGFQGVSTAKDVTTLGRGGSDTTAVALAAAIGADVCEIYTDVAGVFSADPRVVPDARKLPVVSFEEMLEMSASGAGVLQLRSVEYARNHGVQIHCRSSFSDEPGTIVVGEADGTRRPARDHRRDAFDGRGARDARARPQRAGHGGPDRDGARGRQRQHRHDHPERARRRGRGRGHVVHRPARRPARRARRRWPRSPRSSASTITTDESVGKVSVIGEGMKTQSGVAAQVFSTLGEEQINIQMIATSPIKISCVIELDSVQDAVRALHAAFLRVARGLRRLVLRGAVAGLSVAVPRRVRSRPGGRAPPDAARRAAGVGQDRRRAGGRAAARRARARAVPVADDPAPVGREAGAVRAGRAPTCTR